eukprot:CAMPEP_0203953094 /NCGR_PEP_ID=MMETSP0359-20131031/86548_1 /ASSEMBLY_ACC=CAM_ASM_000338 /TAXON_ID=268821 /ORGANISM="Scrippsiella Hangoei, Strain SHTV-5" /LENGTH=480 /DNA_ID=CAMNT_0050886285 /DNA_START=33 /DNA_END=1475 /DNA_ORIENTATION=-
MDDDSVIDPPPDFLDDGGSDDTGDRTCPPPKRANKKAEKRAEKARAREAHGTNHTRELRSVLEVLRALPSAVPRLAAVLVTATHQGADGIVSEDVPRRGPPPPPTQEDVHAVLTTVEEVMRIERPYRDLPQAFGPAEGCDVVAEMIERPPKYQEKYVAQEVSLLAKVWALAGGPASCKANAMPDLAVIDIGAGNGCLALLAAVLLGAHAVLIDHTLPPQELRVEEKVPESYRSRILRINGDVADLDGTRDIEPLLVDRGICRVIVIAKHLCGVGTDAALDLVRRWLGDRDKEEAKGVASPGSTSARVALLGAVFATCCGHKIGGADRALYASLHGGDAYLDALVQGDADRMLQLLSLCTRCVAWRTTAGALANRIMPAQIRIAELFEDALQQPRLNLLRRLFPAAEEVTFVDAGRSPQNRCLVAGSVQGLALATGGSAAADLGVLAALQVARDKLLADVGGCLDLKPKGFVSKKYEYDGS